MNSRQRVLDALNHTQPDKVPVDFSAHRSSGISAIAYARLRRHLALPEKPVRVYDMIQQLAIVDDDVLDRFEIDCIEMGRGFLTEDKDWKDWVLPDGTPCQIPGYVNIEKQGDHWYMLSKEGTQLSVQKKGCLYFEQLYWPMIDRPYEHDDFADLDKVLASETWGPPTPGAHLPMDEQGLAELVQTAKQFRNSTDRAVIGLFGGNLFELGQVLYRMDNFLTYMGLYPDQTIRLIEKLTDIHLANLEKWLTAVGPHIDIVLFGDDLGGQTGPLLSPDMYRRYFKPFHKKLWTRTKQLADVKVMLHCCGGVYPLLDDLIEIGLDTINPVQITCTGMDTARLKSEFGDRLTFWGGGCDTRDILPNAAPEQIAAHVKQQVDILNPDGGFVFQQVHNIQANVPPENITAMFDSIRRT